MVTVNVQACIHFRIRCCLLLRPPYCNVYTNWYPAQSTDQKFVKQDDYPHTKDTGNQRDSRACWEDLHDCPLAIALWIVCRYSRNSAGKSLIVPLWCRLRTIITELRTIVQWVPKSYKLRKMRKSRQLCNTNPALRRLDISSILSPPSELPSTCS